MYFMTISLHYLFFVFWAAAQGACLMKVSARSIGVYTHVPRNTVAGSGGNGGGGSVSPQVWVPILAIAVIFAAVVFVTCTRRRSARIIASAGGAATTAQSAGGTQGSNPQTRSRRTRRARRTPSQISTISLPAYMKEPGEQELVIYRGRSDIEDMPTLEETAESRGPSAFSLYAPYDEHVIPLGRAESHDTLPFTSMANLIPTTSRESTNDSHDSSGSLLPSHQRQPSEDPRGEAPPYFEVVALDNSSQPVAGTSTTSTPYPPPPATAPSGQRQRQSRLSGFFGAFSSRQPPAQPPNDTLHVPGHNRAASAASATPSHGRTLSHGTSHSASGSISTPSVFRVLTRSRSRSHMNSPSTISLDTISAPLTHTVIRSEFQIPKGGLTPEQMKLITSRDAFGRFGMPYGADAVAFSASRLDMQPPPAFDSAVSSGSTHARTPSGLSVSVTRANSPGDGVSLDAVGPMEQDDPTGRPSADAQEQMPSASSPTPSPQPAENRTSLHITTLPKLLHPDPDSRASSTTSLVSANEITASQPADEIDLSEVDLLTPTLSTPRVKNEHANIATLTLTLPNSPLYSPTHPHLT